MCCCPDVIVAIILQFFLCVLTPTLSIEGTKYSSFPLAGPPGAVGGKGEKGQPGSAGIPGKDVSRIMSETITTRFKMNSPFQ